MARECRRKRDEKRFGKAETLADIMVGMPPLQWHAIPPSHDAIDVIGVLQKEMAHVPLIDATNVMDYYALHEKLEWDYAADTPCASPPFAEFWVEMRCPETMITTKGIHHRGVNDAERIGFRVSAMETGGRPIRWCSETGKTSTDVWLEGTRWVLRAQPVLCAGGRPTWASFYKAIPVSPEGRIIGIPVDLFSGLNTLGLDADGIRELLHELGTAFMPLLLSISFMNCKNVTLDPIDPPREIARERRKAGLKPFLRYHTINIEPMKKVLRTEGNVESNGLKKALHICRGHFSHYSEDKPLFGKHAGTFWIPAHTRGSLDRGVVVSDYKVNPPKAGVNP